MKPQIMLIYYNSVHPKQKEVQPLASGGQQRADQCSMRIFGIIYT